MYKNYDNVCIPQLVAMCAAATPDAVALVMGDQWLSYRELNQCANRLAHYLQTLGAGPEVLVGICVERSLDMVVGLLGILKAGAAYVPMDPTYPSERLGFMVKDAQVPLLVTQQHLAGRFAPHKAYIVCLDSDAALLNQQDATDLAAISKFTDLACVLEDLPLTRNGKVDRKALPAPDPTNTLRDKGNAAPTTPTEALLAEIMSSLLGLEQIGIDDNFFMLGGHSLLGTQIIARVAETFSVDLTLYTLFNAPTIRQLSTEVERSLIAKLEAISDEEVLRLLGQGNNA